MNKKPSLAKGTRDFGPATMQKRKFILGSIESEFKKYGFLPLETPAMEQLETLTGKYGDEGDKLLYRILNSGDFTEGISDELWTSRQASKLATKLADKGLRYDLTVPLARFVAMNRNTLVFPFKRYQMQPVWRADRPQRGRYREFWQCDADILGSDSLLNEAELLIMTHSIFEKLGLKVNCYINNRKLLESIAIKFNIMDDFMAFTVLIDKLDKQNFVDLETDFIALGLHKAQVKELEEILRKLPFTEESIRLIEASLPAVEPAIKGCEELRSLLNYSRFVKKDMNWVLDLSLARGLGYYTGTIIEIKSQEVRLGSLSGGGRYDNLTGIFGLPGVSGVGISYGIDRIFDVMEELNLFSTLAPTEVKALFCHFDPHGQTYNLEIAHTLRKQGIAVEVYPDVKKLPKQFEYAEKKGIPLVFISGEDEINNQEVSYKHLISKLQGKISLKDIAANIDKLSV